MGFLDSLFSSSPNQGGLPGYLKNAYEKAGLDPDNETKGKVANQGKKMYCTMCRKVYNGGYKCSACDNILVEWKQG